MHNEGPDFRVAPPQPTSHGVSRFLLTAIALAIGVATGLALSNNFTLPCDGRAPMSNWVFGLSGIFLCLGGWLLWVAKERLAHYIGALIIATVTSGFVLVIVQEATRPC